MGGDDRDMSAVSPSEPNRTDHDRQGQRKTHQIADMPVGAAGQAVALMGPNQARPCHGRQRKNHLFHVNLARQTMG